MAGGNAKRGIAGIGQRGAAGGRKAPSAALGDGGRGAVAGGGERVAQRADDQPAHQAGVAEAHLGLGRMDVDVDLLGRPVEKQRHDRMAVARQDVLIGAAHRADQQLVAHRPAVDEEILVARQAAVEGRQAGEAGQRETRRARRRSPANSRRNRGRAARRAARGADRARAAAAGAAALRSSSPVTVKAIAG